MSKKTSALWRLEVVSTNIARAVYNVRKEKLLIEFKNGSQYVYSAVTVEEFTEFTLAESQGRWFMENIRDQKDCEKRKDAT